MKPFKAFSLILLISVSPFLSCKRSMKTFYQPGVSLELAQYRSKHIYDVHYDLQFQIPAKKAQHIEGKVVIHFKPLKAMHGVILDFQAMEENIHSVLVNSKTSSWQYTQQHIIIQPDYLVPRQNNQVEIIFQATDQALNRAEDFMYTLFVPDRASTAFPCFDQPDIKATFALQLSMPDTWTALTNGPLQHEWLHDRIRHMQFLADKPISTYLFAFAAGSFQTLSETRNGQTINVFHRETDQDKIHRNINDIFDQHFHALQWLESYTAIPYPFEKLDIAILPGFQYSGMEHPGAIWYRDDRLLLDPNPPITQQLRKANLIAHETAHMWFGNLVTMQWFDDVWLKEVFAGFMADKITSEQFPEVNHRLQFMLSHYPRAYGIDRSQGTHPIKQQLQNLKMAGTLYGPIIYNKAPIVFEQLEHLMSPPLFKEAVREYLSTFAYGNADWSDLARIFDAYTPHDILNWSKTWIEGSGMPRIEYTRNDQHLTLTQNRQKYYPEQLWATAWLHPQALQSINIQTRGEVTHSEPIPQAPNIQGILLNGAGMGYGFFPLQAIDLQWLIRELPGVENEVYRASGYLNLHENFLNHRLRAEEYLDFLCQALEQESNQQLLNYLLNNLQTICFQFLPENRWGIRGEELSEMLWNKLNDPTIPGRQAFFESWIKMATGEAALQHMVELLQGTRQIPQLELSENLITNLAFELAIRSKNHEAIIHEIQKRITNPDRLRRFEFIRPAISHKQTERDAFFQRIQQAENRRPEPWVLDALYFLHHPLHPNQGMAYLPQSLKMLSELQITGDIFFPQNWLQAILSNYSGKEATELVVQFLEQEKDLPDNLRLKVLQSADILFRSAEMAKIE